MRPRHAEQAVGPEDLGIEERLVDAAVDHVDAPRAARRAHEDPVVVDEEIRGLHELEAHRAREEAVLEIGRIVRPRREHDAVASSGPIGDTERSVSARRVG